MLALNVQTRIEILPQPDDLTCGPTCLHAVYRFYGDDLPLEQLIGEVAALEEGGTLAVFLACHALRRGYRATIYTCNLQMFDPTWFASPAADLRAKLIEQQQAKADPKLHTATRGYLELLDRGGRLRFEDITTALLRRYLKRSRPILTGLSATYLYREARERNCDSDDVRGLPVGHFVVLCDYDPERRTVLVADPLHPNPLASDANVYAVSIERVLGAILLGVITYDANLLILEPPARRKRPPA
jgi:hypothetical protein